MVSWYLISKKRKIGNHIPVLCYHRVLPEFVSRYWSILPEQFESQLTFLIEEEFNTLSLTEYERMARGLDPIRERSVLMTFDDGFADNHAIAWKIARKNNIKINLFICPSYIDKDRPVVMGLNGYIKADSPHQRKLEEEVRPYVRKYPELWRPLTWKELREMQDAGVNIGFHSHSHHRLASLTSQELIADTTAGLAIMERELGQRPRFFSLPYGGYNDYNPRVISVLKSLGLDLIFVAHPGRVRLPSRQPVFPRIQISQQDNLATFRQKIWGVYDWWGEYLQIKHVIKTSLRK